jgi:surface protein
MKDLFNGCSSLLSLDLSNFNTEKITNMGHMFSGCKSLKGLDLSNFITNNVTNMSRMFYGCKKLTTLDIRNFTFDKVTSYSNMFSNVPANCLIIVKGETEKEWVLARRSDLTNVKTVAEYEAS